MYANSDRDMRGVAILKATDIPGELENFFRDDEQNLLAATYHNGTGKIRLVSIYGPNENDKEFF
jgi:hypothetical protein